MALSGRQCPDCGRKVKARFEETITGREVCPDCAEILRKGSSIGAIVGPSAGYGVWAMLRRRFKRSSD